ncbi:hypothetical protein FLG15_15805 [Xanthomonas phaseoli pv. dieffenbachiae]
MPEGFGKGLRGQKRQRFGIVRRGAANAGHAGPSGKSTRQLLACCGVAASGEWGMGNGEWGIGRGE